MKGTVFSVLEALWRFQRSAVIVTLGSIFGIASVRPASGQTWTKSSAPDTNWQALACSADGKRVVATFAGGVFLSADSGADWVRASNAPALLYPSIASSADGTHLVVGCNSNAPSGPELGPILLSSDAGTNWSSAGVPFAEWQAVACSGDGSRLVGASRYVGPNLGVIYTSTNSGGTWRLNAVPQRDWDSIAVSADGLKLAVAVRDPGGVFYPTNPGVLYTSTNWGINWSSMSVPGMFWFSIAGSAGGDKLVGTSYNGTSTSVYTSVDSASTWTSNNVSLNVEQQAYVASSAGGRTLIVAVPGRGIWVSTDGGADWVLTDAPNANWKALACSADGHRAFAAATEDGIYVLTTRPAPQISLTQSNGNLAISWEVPSAPFVLEACDLMSCNWSNACAQPCLNCSNLQMELTVPLGNGAASGFFRLRSSP